MKSGMAAKSTSYQFPGQKGQPYELNTTLSPSKPNTTLQYVMNTKLCRLSLAFIKDWRAVTKHIQQVSNSSRFVFRENNNYVVSKYLLLFLQVG